MSAYPLTYNEFKQGLSEGRLLGLKCLECGEAIVPPSAACCNCGGVNLERSSFAKKGRIRTFTVVRVGPEGFNAPYIVALVELDDGPWVLGNLVGVEADQAGMEIIDREVSVSSKVAPPGPSDPEIEGVALIFEMI